MQIQYKHVTLHTSRLFHVVEFDCLALELQQLFSVSQWKTAIFVWAAA